MAEAIGVITGTAAPTRMKTSFPPEELLTSQTLPERSTANPRRLSLSRCVEVPVLPPNQPAAVLDEVIAVAVVGESGVPFTLNSAKLESGLGELTACVVAQT